MHRARTVLRPTVAAAALLLGLLAPAAPPPAAAAAGPTMTEYFTVQPQGYLQVGDTVTGTVGRWSGTGSLSYELRWELCSTFQRARCTTVASRTTTDPSARLRHTLTEADNFSDGVLVYSVTAQDASGTTTVPFTSGTVHPQRRWYEGTPSGTNGAHAALDSQGVATFVGREQTQDVRGLYARRVTTDGPPAPRELVYRSSWPDDDRTHEVAVAVDGQDRVHVVFVDDQRRLMVTDRDPGTGTWAAPTLLARAGEYDETTFRDTDGEGLLAVAGRHAVVAWAGPADADDPAEIQVATRGASGWAGASVHTADQPKYIDCPSPDVTVSAPWDAELAVDEDGDVTVAWGRSEQFCPGDAWQSYNRLEAVHRRGGTWSPVVQLARTPGFYGNYVPVAVDAGRAGTAIAMTRGYFDGDSQNTRDELVLLRAPGDAALPPIGSAGSALTVVRRWRNDPEVHEGHLSGSGGIDLEIGTDGGLHVVWGATNGHPGGRSTLEAVAGTVAGGVGPLQTIASRPYDEGFVDRSPRIALDGGRATAVFTSGLAGGSSGDSTTTYDPGTQRWSTPQTVHTGGEYPQRWLTGGDHVLGYDAAGRLRLVRSYGHGGGAVTRQATGRTVPRVAVSSRTVKTGTPTTLAPDIAEDPDGGALGYAWDLDGDGAFDDATTREVTRTFAVAGRTHVALRVTATDGDFSVSRAFVDAVENSAPTIYGLFAQGTPTAGSPTTFVAQAGDDFDEQGRLRYRWSFDGVTDSTQTGATATRTLSSGWHRVEVTVTDSDGAFSSLSREFLVEGEDPVPSYTLTVDRAGDGTGRVVGPGISCGTDCTHSAPSGTEVTLDATPGTGSVLTGWTGCTQVLDGSCVVRLGADTQVTATFDRAAAQQRTLTVTRAGAGVGTVTGDGIDCGTDCSTVVPQGRQVRLTAEPGASSRITGWSGCTEVVDGGLGCLVTLDDDEDVRATFEPRAGAVETTITSTKVVAKRRKATVGFDGYSPAGVARFECTLDDGSWKDCTSPKVFKRLSRGSHTVRVRTVDLDGLRDATPAETTFKVKRR